MSVQENEVLVKITSAGTISIPKQFRKYMDVQKGEYVKLILGKDELVVRKITISWIIFGVFWRHSEFTQCLKTSIVDFGKNGFFKKMKFVQGWFWEY